MDLWAARKGFRPSFIQPSNKVSYKCHVSLWLNWHSGWQRPTITVVSQGCGLRDYNYASWDQDSKIWLLESLISQQMRAFTHWPSLTSQTQPLTQKWKGLVNSVHKPYPTRVQVVVSQAWPFPFHSADRFQYATHGGKGLETSDNFVWTSGTQLLNRSRVKTQLIIGHTY